MKKFNYQNYPDKETPGKHSNKVEEELDFILQIKENLGITGMQKTALIEEMIEKESNVMFKIKYTFNEGHETAHIGTNTNVNMNGNVYRGVDIKCQRGHFNKFIIKDTRNGYIGVVLVSGEKIKLENLEMDLSQFHLICNNGGFFVYIDKGEIYIEEISGKEDNKYYENPISPNLRISDEDYEKILRGLKDVDIEVVDRLINQGLDTKSIAFKLLDYKMISEDTAMLLKKYSHLFKL